MKRRKHGGQYLSHAFAPSPRMERLHPWNQKTHSGGRNPASLLGVVSAAPRKQPETTNKKARERKRDQPLVGDRSSRPPRTSTANWSDLAEKSLPPCVSKSPSRRKLADEPDGPMIPKPVCDS